MSPRPADVERGSAPTRLCLGGEDLDWMDGPALLSAIDLRVTVDFEARPVCSGLTIEADGSLRATLKLPPDEWFEQTTSTLELARLCWQLRQEPHRHTVGGRMRIWSSAPPSAGLASSATACVAILRALTPLPAGAPQLLMTDAYHVERTMAGRPVGPMDFVPAAFGGTVLATSAAERTTDLTHLSLPPDTAFLVVDTHTPRDTGAVIAWKRARLAARDADIRIYAKRTRILVAEQARLLRTGTNLEALGQTLNTAHEYLRRHLRVSTPLIDECIDRLRSNGALGAKITGTGLGGCLFALVPAGSTGEQLAACLTDLPVTTHLVTPAAPEAAAEAIGPAASGAVRPSA